MTSTFMSRRFVLYAPLALAVLAGLTMGSLAWAFVRLATSSSGATGLFWASGSLPIPFAIHGSGSADMPEDDREAAAIRLAFESWGGVDGSGLGFQEVTSAAIVDGPKVAQNDGVNLVFFDEQNASGRFTNASFIVAITPVFFDGQGRITDADIIFNGRDHAFTTSPGQAGEAGKFDVQNIATHEIGHFVGLDHSGIHGGTMIPFAIPGETRLRSLAADEIAAARAVYPGSAPIGRITGSVQHQAGGGVDGAHVVAASLATGEPVGSAITRTNGTFDLLGLPPGSYRVYAEPFDGPTEDGNLQRDGIDVGFQTRFVGTVDSPTTVTVSASATTDVGAIVVPAGTGLNIEGLTPRTIRRGQVTQLFLSGTQLNGCEVEIRGAGVTFDPVVALGRISVNVSASAPLGLRDLYLRRGAGATREVVVLAGALDLVDAPPALAAVVPDRTPVGGGASVQLTGQGFAAGARVVVGDQVVPTFDAVFDSPSSLTVTVPAGSQPGDVAVTVINPDGQESRLEGALTYTGDPTPTAVDPRRGPTTGGVTATIDGNQFAAGAVVRFGARSATNVVVDANGNRITCTTPSGVVGQTVAITVQNPDGSSGSLASAYTYSAPQIVQLAPTLGSTSGGTEVQVLGDAFAPSATVRFGGTSATRVTFISQFELRAIAPARPAGPVAVTVTLSDGQTGTTQPTAFSYVAGVQPQVTSVAPASGSSAGGDSVTVRGQGFEAGARVRIGGAEATGVEVVSSTEIVAVTPAGSGSANVSVTNPTGLEDTAFAAYAYVTVQAQSSGGGGGGGFGCTLAPAGSGGAAGREAAALPLVLLAAALAVRALRARRRAA